jgi:hypothetical protein
MPPVWCWHGGIAVGLAVVPPAPYVFVSSAYVFSPRVRTYIVPAARVGVIAPRTRPYVAASPVAVGGAYHSYALTRAPSLQDAHVPPRGVPSQRVAADPRAASFARSYNPGPARVPSAAAGAPVYTRPSTPPAVGPRPVSPSPGAGPRPASPAPAPAAAAPRPVSPPAPAPVAPSHQGGFAPGGTRYTPAPASGTNRSSPSVPRARGRGFGR